jgi:hypothetical protein
MQFSKRLRDGIRRGQITCTIRIWMRPQVKVGGSYSVEGGAIVVDSMERIELEDISDALARRSGFADVADLLSVAKHGSGSDVYLIEFHFVPAEAAVRAKAPRRR